MSDNNISNDVNGKSIFSDFEGKDITVSGTLMDAQQPTSMITKERLSLLPGNQTKLRDSLMHSNMSALSIDNIANNKAPMEDANHRKVSFQESELSEEEIKEDDEDIRRKVNQKLIKNKNYFDLMGKYSFIQKKFQDDLQSEQSDIVDQTQYKSQTYDKRSKSETPEKMSATEVLFRAHKKLQGRRKQSPSKILEKHQQRQVRLRLITHQKKAEELRGQIEESKKNWYNKIRIRQQIVKSRFKRLMDEKKAKLRDKLEHAEERREFEIQTLKNKAKQEIQKIDETNLIMKMTMNNMKMDLDHKMTETLERRNQILEESKQKQIGRQLKEEAAEKRRQELMKETENKFLKYKDKRDQADLRRTNMLEKKKKTAEDKSKRDKVLQRKNNLGDTICDIMSFVSNSENIWDFLGNETDWQDLGIIDRDNLIFALLQGDHLQIEKIQLKKDAELLSQMIQINEKGQIYSHKDLLPLARRKYAKNRNDNYDSDQDYDIDYGDESPPTVSPNKDTMHHSSNALDHYGYNSDGSDRASMLEEFPVESLKTEIMTDEQQQYQLYSQRLKMSMKRNVLKKTMSEDLTWAYFLKNEGYYMSSQNRNFNIKSSSYTRSMHSTPERKQEIPCESGKENIGNELTAQPAHTSSSSSGITQNSNSKFVLKAKQDAAVANQNTSSSSNLSDKNRISNEVYPSKKKKNPNNNNAAKKGNPQLADQMKAFGSFNGNQQQKNLTGGSNNSSTQSLILSSQNFASEAAKDQGKQSTDSARKKQFARLHSSSVQECSSSTGVSGIGSLLSGLQPSMQISEDRNNEGLMGHTGSQMSQLIVNSRPNFPMAKIVPKKLSINANKMLFPIREQKLLLKRPGKEGQFGKCRSSARIEDLLLIKVPLQTNLIPEQKVQPLQTQPEERKDIQEQLNTSSKRSQESTPNVNKRKEDDQVEVTSLQGIVDTVSIGTPKSSRLSAQHAKLQQSLICNLQQQEQQQVQTPIQSETTSSKRKSLLNSEPSPSPKKDLQKSTDANTSSQMGSPTLDSTPMNEQGYKEILIKFLFTDNIQALKSDDYQKTIALEGVEADKLIDYLEVNELSLRYCRLCDLIIPDHMTNENHCQLKAHKKTRDELGIKEVEDFSYSIFTFTSVPGDIEKELLKEKEKALKRKVKRIKAQMISQAVSHESASSCPGKGDVQSVNKKRFYILCIDLERAVIPIIKDYEALECILKDLIKILDQRKQSDLHLMRKLKFIPTLIEICKRISVCHKNEFKHLGRVLEYVVKIINIFCGLRENRNYLLQTNRLQALIELLNWCLNRPTQLFYGINFMPQLFHILTTHVKHRAPYECQQMKEMFIEYLICSQIIVKVKSKFQIINGPLDLSEMMGQVPLFLLKSATFIESLTSLISMDARDRPIYEKSIKIAEHVLFVIQNTEFFGIIPMITTILLTRNQPFKPSQSYQPVVSSKILPQTILSLAITSIKILNNVYRMDYRFAQQMMVDFDIQEQLYHLLHYLLAYTLETSETQEDSKELLHETILLMGYFCLNNEKNQQILCKGENTLLQKLCNLPFPYFCDKKLKEILYPTLISASYKNDRALAIMDQEISIAILVDYLQMNIKEELPKIIEEECDYQSMSSLSAVERKTNRSPSISSTNSSNCSLQLDLANGNSPYLPFYMRFPKKAWKDAITFYSKALY